MDTSALIIIALLGAVTVALVVVLFGRKQHGGSEGLQATIADMVMREIGTIRKVLDDRLVESSQVVRQTIDTQHHQSERVQQLIQNVTREITEMKHVNQKVADVSNELKILQDILKNPKQRGVLGEYYLETLLKNVLAPGQYEMQYKFRDGEIVDAVVFLGDQIIPVDSKFSLENYNRLNELDDSRGEEKARLETKFVNDLKERIKETSKYIRPEENTMDFAFMFIPHEAIYYDLLVNKIGALKLEDENLIQRAAGKYRVIIVSPTSFLAYLQTVLQGLKALKIEESAKKIQTNVEELGKHLKQYETYHGKLGQTLGTAVSHYNASLKEFKKIDKDIVKITGAESELLNSAETLDKPLLEV